MIKVEKLNKYYNKGKSNELHVINETSLTFADTGLVCILGESGSGKTTLMNTISGLDDFANGTIDVDGETITKFGSAKQESVRNEKFGYIFQNYYLLQERSVAYNIKLALSLYDISEEEKESRVDYVLKAVGMARFKKRLVSQLSGGQQQRIAIARALAKTPRVIFADEPTGNLDEQNTMKIMGILKKVSKDCLVILVTHERSIADFFADRILEIADGKVVKDFEKTSHGTYSYNDDNNLYLQEYEKKTYDHEASKLETFSNEEAPGIKIRLIYENGKYYVTTESEVPIEYLTADKDIQVIDSKRPQVDLSEIEEMDYNLASVQSTKKPKLSLKEIWSIAISNIAMMGKRQVLLVLTFLVMAVLVVLTVQDMMGILSINKEDVVTNDSHVISVRASKGALISSDEMDENFGEFISDVEKNQKKVLIMPETSGVKLYYQYEGFWQLENVTSALEGFTVVPLEKLSKKDLIYGRMPKGANEIVIDRWVLDQFINGESEVANMISNVEHFLNGTVTTATEQGDEYKIVGISDSKEPDVYMDKFQALSFSDFGSSVTSLDTLKALDDSYASTNLAKDECLLDAGTAEEAMLSELTLTYHAYVKYYTTGGFRNAGRDADFDEYEKEYGITYQEFLELLKHPEELDLTYTAGNDMEFKVAGILPDDYPASMVLSDEAYASVVLETAKKYHRFAAYSEDREGLKELIEKKLSKEYGDTLNFTINDKYGDDMAKLKEERSQMLSARLIVTITIFVISMILLYFTMKANVAMRITDLGVYRLLGISKGSIIGLFAIENAVITSYTSLLGVIVTTIITKFIASVPSLEMDLVYPWYAILFTILFLYLVNIVIGILPVRKMLKLPPAQLAAKYDM